MAAEAEPPPVDTWCVVVVRVAITRAPPGMPPKPPPKPPPNMDGTPPACGMRASPFMAKGAADVWPQSPATAELGW